MTSRPSQPTSSSSQASLTTSTPALEVEDGTYPPPDPILSEFDSNSKSTSQDGSPLPKGISSARSVSHEKSKEEGAHANPAQDLPSSSFHDTLITEVMDELRESGIGQFDENFLQEFQQDWQRKVASMLSSDQLPDESDIPYASPQSAPVMSWPQSIQATPGQRQIIPQPAEAQSVSENQEPLDSDSDDSVSEEEPTDSDNVILCQSEKINKHRNKFELRLKEGVVKLNGRESEFKNASGTLDWES